MGNLSIGQMLIVVLVCVLIFGDVSGIVKSIKRKFLKKKDRKKGI
jgi:Sec-independent protein translocase protein TatA